MTDLLGFGVKSYRSFFSSEPAIIGPLSKINLFAGQNNAGKSNVLRFAQEVLSGVHKLAPQLNLSFSTDPFVAPVRGNWQGTEEVVLALRRPDDIRFLFGDKGAGLSDQQLRDLEMLFKAPAFQLSQESDLVWFRYVRSDQQPRTLGQRGQTPFDISARQLKDAFSEIVAQGFGNYVMSAIGTLGGVQYVGGHVGAQLLTQLIGHIEVDYPAVATLPAFRQVRTQSADAIDPDHSGVGLIQQLAQLERPEAAERKNRERFERINRFVQVVLDDETARLEVPHSRATINVDRRGDLLPLESLGTGVHEVVIIAAAATILEDHLVCIEEPEVHLHPLLQRKLLRYLASETNNQYLIATHSAHLLDAEIATIFHVTIDDEGSHVLRAASGTDRAAICADLGYRPSDLVQANAVIWVEGPSDRIYLRHWLRRVDPTLVEGIHYSIMFYGGRLLNHLTALDDEITEFINLKRLNRQISILIDSDKEKPRGRINSTKSRIRDEFGKGPGFAWITQGYTIENYIPVAILQDAVRSAHSAGSISWSGDMYENPFGPKSWRGTPAQPDKIKIARAAVDAWPTEVDPTADAAKQVGECVRFIRSANGPS